MTVFNLVPVSKGLLFTIAIGSILAAVTSTQSWFNLPLHPHLIRDYQVYRLFFHHSIVTNSVSLFIIIILLFNTSIPLERSWGSHKYISFLVSMTAIITMLEGITLVLGSNIGFNTIPAGPFALSFAIMYQYYRIIPTLYHWNLYTFKISSRAPLYLLAFQLLLSPFPSTLIVSLIGILVSYLYRSSSSLQSYRISLSLVALSRRFLLPLLGTDPVVRRSTAATHAEAARAGNNNNFGVLSTVAFGRSVATTPATTGIRPTTNTATTARRQVGNDTIGLRTRGTTTPPPTGFVSQWTEGLTGAQGGLSSSRAPTADEIASLQAIFPNLPQNVIISSLRSNQLDVTRAAEQLLSIAS